MNADHLDDEAISALLDGMADADAAAHGDSCAPCRGRLAELAKVRAAIAEPVATRDPAAVDSAIAAALDARHPHRTVARPRRAPLWLAGAAAAVLAVGVAIPLVSGLGRGSAKKSASSATSARANGTATAGGPSVAAGEGGAAGGPAAFGAAGSPGGPDLGEQDDPAALAQALRGFQGAQAVGGSPGDAGASADANTARPAPTAAAAGTPAVPPSCEPAAAASVGSTVDRLRVQATLRWQGQPAVLFAFGDTTDGRLVAAVLSVDGCRLLVTVTA